MTTLTVSKNELVKAVEFYSTTCGQEPNWIELGGHSFKDFFYEDEIGSFVNIFDSSSYQVWLDACGYEDTEENYSEWVEFERSSLKDLMTDLLPDGTEVIYID